MEVNKMETEKKPNLDDWDDFAGEYLKCDDIATFPLLVACIGVEADYEDDKAKLTAIVEYKGRQRKIGLNKTNQDVIKANKITPKGLIGKKLTFGKHKVRNPTTNSLVDSFLIETIK